MTVQQIEQEIELRQKTYEDEIEKIATRAYNAHIVPFCQKYNLTYSAGMGTWSFRDSDKNQVGEDYYDSDVWYGARLKELKDICDLLYIDCGDNSLGEYMPDYKGK